MRRLWQPLPDTFIGALVRGALSGVFMLGVVTITNVVSPWPVAGGWPLIPIFIAVSGSFYLVKKQR